MKMWNYLNFKMMIFILYLLLWFGFEKYMKYFFYINFALKEKKVVVHESFFVCYEKIVNFVYCISFCDVLGVE